MIETVDFLPSTEIHNWFPQPGPQTLAVQLAYVEELLYGGAVGGGKSDFLLGDFAQDVLMPWGPYHRGILFRKSYPELEDLMRRAIEIYTPMFGDMVRFTDNGKNWEWANGAELRFRHMENDLAWTSYQGHDFTWIGFDEIGQWGKPDAYLAMKARLRSAHGHPYKRMRATANPGGAGHAWLKEYFKIDEHPLGGEIFRPGHTEAYVSQLNEILKQLGLPPYEETRQMRRVFVKARVTDNKILLNKDPDYYARLFDLGSVELMKAFLAGDWDILAGAFFTEWNADRHVIKPFTIPAHWTRFRSMDWGSSAPFSVGWYAVSDGEPVPGVSRRIPRGALVKYREWYGCSKPNVGLKLKVADVAGGIKERERDEKIEFGVIDPSAGREDGGPSIKEQLATNGVYFVNADNSRIPGWQQVRNRLQGDTDPMLFFFDTCKHTIRTVPYLQHDKHKIEDIDSKSEDHAADETRYACMTRPWTRDEPKKLEQKFAAVGQPDGSIVINQTINDLIAEHRKKRLRQD